MKDKLKTIYTSLSGKDKEIATFLIANTEEALTLNISQVAKRINVSSASISRFTKLLFGMTFPQFKVALAKSLNDSENRKESFRLSLDDSIFQIEKRIAGNLGNLFSEIVELNKAELINQIAKKIAKAENIYLFGIGASGLVVQDLSQKLIKLGKRTLFNLDGNHAILNSSLCTPNDLVIAISYSGLTKEVLVPVKKAKKLGTPVVSLTGGRKNRLISESDYVLSVPLTEDKIIRMTAIYSRYGLFYLADILYMATLKELTDSPEKLMEKYKDLLLELK